MSDFAAILAMTALAYPHVFIFWFVDRILRDRLEMVATGIARGVPMSVEFRRTSFWSSWFIAVAGGIGGQVVIGVLWLVAAKHAQAGDVRVVALVGAFMSLMCVLAFVYRGMLWAPRLASLLRQAEAD